MKLYTNANNTSTLKLLIAANLAGKKVEIQNVSLAEDASPAPHRLPRLEVDDELVFFSSNAAVQYLFPVLDMTDDGQCQQMQEWEATRLHPAVASVLTSKAVAADLKQALLTYIQTLDVMRSKHKFIVGDKISAADVTIWSTLYPVYYNDDLKQQYMIECKNICAWFEEIAAAKAVREAVKLWGGSASAPYAVSSALGIPQLSTLTSPAGTPEDEDIGVTAEELEAAREGWCSGLSGLPAPVEQQKVVLPIKGRKNVLITSALPYVNNVPHLGNIIGCVLSGDIFARYCRLCGYNTLYISGTDEYGTATETKALEENLTPRQICDKYFEIHNAVYRWFDIGFDYFGRTSTPQQTEIAQKLFLKLKDNGFVSSQSVEQLLCEKCDRFLADRFVEGHCPHPGCGYESARGDQCDKCGRLINAAELLQPRCKVCASAPVLRDSEQLFLELPQLEPSIRAWLGAAERHWSGAARGVARAWLREPLRPRAITRDLKWGVAVPIDKYKDKVFYVWFDAPIGYLSITECATKQYEKWWRPDKDTDVTLYQFMAKDNVPFHSIMFPATILGINEGHLQVKHLFATEYLNYEEGKFSKSRGVGVFGTDAQETGIPSDVWRFYLASIRPETSDSSFSWSELGTRNNSELLNNLGNFCHRSLSFCANSFNRVVPAVQLNATELELVALVNREIKAYVSNMEKGRLRDALRNVLSMSRRGNQHMQATQPWVLLKGTNEDKQHGASTIGICCQLVCLLCSLLVPYIPAAARELSKQLNIELRKLALNPNKPSFVPYLPANHTIGSPAPLFAKLDPERLEALRAKYAGTQSERASQQNGVSGSIADMEAAVTAQADKVRKLKASTKDKTAWQPEVDKLLQLKKQLTSAQGSAKKGSVPNASSNKDLEKLIAEQGEKVRKLKASTKDKTVWQPEVNKLLELKKQLTSAQSSPVAPSGDAKELERKIAEQGDKVRQLKTSTKDKSVWQPEVNILLDLKKQLAALQVK